MATTYMGMTLPTVLVTAGSTYATYINAAMEVIDAHDHSSGKGTQVVASGININANLSFGGNSATSLKSTIYTQQASHATANSLYFKTDNNLWCTNGSGTAIQLTSGSGLNTAALITSIWSYLAVSTNYTIVSTDNYTYFKTDTAATRTYTLPAASAVTAGRFYVIVDSTGSAATNNITINRAGSDTINGGTSHVIDRNYGYAILVSDGTSAWNLANPINATSANHGVIKLAGDLGGTAAAPTVVSLTGSSNKVTLASGTATIEFNAATSAPTIKSADNASTAGTSMNLLGQNAAGSNQAGGPVNVTGGSPTGTGTPGYVNLGSSVSSQLRVGAFSSTRRYVAVATSMPTTTDIPTGDGVIYIGEAVTAPSSNPVSGAVLYVSSGRLGYRPTAGAAVEFAEVVSAAVGGSQDKKIKVVDVGSGSTYYIPLHTA